MTFLSSRFVATSRSQIPTRHNKTFSRQSALLESVGFAKRTKGSHNIFRKSGVEERINLQRDGSNAKPYQVKQVRAVMLKYKLG